MTAARIYGPRDLRIDSVPHPGQPGPEQVLLRITAVGICGSDLHTFIDGRIGDTSVQEPLIMGHEFGAVVEAVGENCLDGNHEPLAGRDAGGSRSCTAMRALRDVREGSPQSLSPAALLRTLSRSGSLCEYMIMPAHTCFPVPDEIDDAGAAMLEPLGVAIHAIDLAKIRVADSVAIIGAGPIGQYILQLAKLSGADPIFVSDKLEWRLKLAEEFGAIPINFDEVNPTEFRQRSDRRTGRGCGH